MSDEETQILHTEDGQMLTAEYKDGQLQIVEVAAFDKGRYVQVMDNEKGVMSLDLLSLIKSEGNATYQLVSTSTGEDGDDTYVLAEQELESEDNENQDSYVIVNAEEEGRDPLVYLQSTLQQINTQQSFKNDTSKKKLLTPEQILEKAKALQKANALRVNTARPGRKRKSSPEPIELLSLLSSPGFKLYLYSCKQCSFKCNAIKEMSKHKATEHMAGRARGGSGRSAGATLQCARCPYRASGHTQLVKHVSESHFAGADGENVELVLDSEEVSDADVLVCGACGFESSEKTLFRRHIESAHGVNVTLTPAVITLEDDVSPANDD